MPPSSKQPVNKMLLLADTSTHSGYSNYRLDGTKCWDKFENSHSVAKSIQIKNVHRMKVVYLLSGTIQVQLT